jgi:hypothetical protein
MAQETDHDSTEKRNYKILLRTSGNTKAELRSMQQCKCNMSISMINDLLVLTVEAGMQDKDASCTAFVMKLSVILLDGNSLKTEFTSAT